MATARATGIPLQVQPYTNPRTGTISWRVSGQLQGQRVRKNFATEAEALAWRGARVAVRSVLTPRPVLTHLDEATVRQAEAAVARLPANTDLRQAVDFFAVHHRPLTPRPMSVPAAARAEHGEGAIEAFGAWLETQRKNEAVTVTTRETVLRAFARAAGVTRSDRITVEQAQAWIYEEGAAVRTHRDRYDLLRRFCAWLVDRRLAAFNPVEELDRPVVKIAAPRVLSFGQAEALLQAALTDPEGPEMLPFFALGLLSGMRPDEVPRLDGWDDIHLGDEHRLIEVNRAKGGRARRNVTIHPALGRILAWCRERKLAPNFFSKRKFDRIRDDAGVRELWQKDILRHTYASMRYVLTKDVKQLEHDMGNSERVLFQSYIRPVPLAEARKFEALALDYTAPRRPSRMGTGPKPRAKNKRPPGRG